MKKIFLSSVALLGLSMAAQAADLPRRTMAPAPFVAAVPAFTWTGFYFGVNAGYGWSDNGHSHDFDIPAGVLVGGNDAGRVAFTDNNNDADGFLGGAQIGWNYQFTPGSGFVVGIEADIQAIDLDRDNRFGTFTGPAGVTALTFAPVSNGASSLDWFGTVRGRLGYAFDRVLVYATGGFAYGNGDDRNICPVGFTDPACRNDDDTRWGYAVGGGVEWALPVTASLFGSSAVTFKVEGLYVNLDNDNNRNLVGFDVGTGGPIFVTRGDQETEFGLVRAGVNFKF